MARVFVALIIAVVMAGCGATYPQSCSVERVDGERTWVCRCSTLTARVTSHPDKPAPAGKAVWSCDGSNLPVEVVSDNIGLPKCQE